MDDYRNDPVLAEAIARRDESRAQILRARAARAGGTATDRLASAFEKLAGQAAKDSRSSAEAAANIEPPARDLSGTAPTLSDSEGNFAANPEVANAGGTGVEASNTNVETGEPAMTAEEAGAVQIPDNWRNLSWQERRSLASQLSDEPVTNGDQANAAIEAELKRRSSAR